MSKQNKTKFVIVSMARSGSTFLVSLLDSHPQVFCEDGILLHRSPHKSLRVFYQQGFSKDSVQACGFKILQNQNSHLLQQVLAASDIKKILLFRRDDLRHFYSLQSAQKHGIFHIRPFSTTLKRRLKSIASHAFNRNLEGFIKNFKNFLITLKSFRRHQQPYEPQPMELDVQAFERFQQEKLRYFQELRKQIQKTGQSVFEVDYEDLLGEAAAQKCQQIQDFLELPLVPLQAKTKRMNNKPTEELILNSKQLLSKQS